MYVQASFQNSTSHGCEGVAVAISKLLDLPVINLVNLYIALDYHQCMLLWDSLPKSVKGIKVSQDSKDIDVIFSISMEGCMMQLEIMDFDNKQKTFGFNCDLVIDCICDIKAGCLNSCTSVFPFVIWM